MSQNKCEGCPRNCCINFSIGEEFHHPLRVRDELKKFPFIHLTGRKLVLGWGGS